MVEADEIVVDGLGDMDGAQRMAFARRLFGDDAHCVGGIVAADVKESVDLLGAQHLEDFLAIFAVGLVARRAERRRWAGSDRFQVDGGLLAEIDQILVDDAAHAMPRAIDVIDAGEPAGFERHADQRLVDNSRRPSPLRHQNPARHSALPPLGEAPPEASCRRAALRKSAVFPRAGSPGI